MNLIDCHTDTLTTLLSKGANLKVNTCHVSIKELKKYDNAGIYFAIWLNSEKLKTPYISTMEVIDFYYNQIALNDDLSHVNSYYDMINAFSNNKVGSILSLEGGEALEGNIDNLYKFYGIGVRGITLTWNNSNDIGNGSLSGNDEGLKPFGKTVVKEMEKLKMIVDVSHLNNNGFYDVIKICDKKIIASHSNAKKICDSPRNLDDYQLRELANKKCLVGINFHGGFVNGTKHDYTFEDILKHIDYIMNILGENGVCIGSDFDGTDYLPCTINKISDNIPLYYMLEKEYNKTIANKIFYQNQLDFLKDTL